MCIILQIRRQSIRNCFCDVKFNDVAYLLAYENGVSVKVAKYAGTDKVDLIEIINSNGVHYLKQFPKMY